MKVTKHLRILLYVFGTLVILGAVGWGVLTSSWFQMKLERRVIAYIEKVSGCRVEVGQFQFRPLALQVVFHDLTLHGLESPRDAPLFSAQTVDLRISGSQLWHRQIRLREFAWDNAEIHLRAHPDGTTNLPPLATGFPRDKALSEMMNLAVGRVTLAHTTVCWNDSRLPLSLEAQDLAILLRFGQGRKYVGSLASSAIDVRSARWSPVPFAFTSWFELTSERLDVKTLGWHSKGLSGRGSLTVHILPSPEASFALSADADAPALGRLLQTPQLKAGRLHLDSQGTFRQGALSAHGGVEAREVLLSEGSFRAGRFNATARFTVDNRKVDISNFDVSGWGGSAQGQVEIALRDPAPDFHANARLRNLDLAKILPLVSSDSLFVASLHPVARIDGKAEATWTGNFAKLQSGFRMTLRAPGTSIAQTLPVNGIIQGSVNRNETFSVTIENADLQFPHSSLQAQGSIGELRSASRGEQRSTRHPTPQMTESGSTSATNAQIKFKWQTTDFEEWRPAFQVLADASQPIPLTLNSTAVFSGDVTGSLSNPQIQGRVEIGNFRIDRWTWDRLIANVVASSEYVAVNSGRVERGGSSLSLDGSVRTAQWRMTPNSVVSVTARADRAPIDSLKAAVGATFPASGLISGQINLHGTPALLAGDGAFKVEKGNVSGEPFDSLGARFHIAQSIWNFEDIQVIKGHGTITGQGTFEPAKQEYSGQFKGSGLLLSDFSHLSRLRPTKATSAAPALIDGRAGFELSGHGTGSQFQIHSTVSVENMLAGGAPVGDFRAQIDSQGQQLHFQGEVNGTGGKVQISGDARAEANWPLTLAGQFENFRLDPWIRLFADGRFNTEVTAGGSFKLTGAIRNPNTFELQGQAQHLEVSLPSTQWKNDQPVAFHYASHQLVADRFRMRGPSTDLQVGGSVRLSEPAALSFDAQGTADATVLSLFDPSVQATGKADLKVHVGGTPSLPQLGGNVDIQNVNVRYGDMPFQLTGMNGDVRLEGDRAVISSLRGTSGGGTVSLSGAVTLGEIPRFDLGVDLQQARLHYPADFTSLVNGTIRLEGTPEHGLLHGDLVIRQVYFSENVNWLAQLMEANNPFTEKPSGVPSPSASRIRVNVRVTSSPPIRIESRDLRLVADVDLRLQGTLANPVEVGTIHLTGGEAVFRGNRYKLNRGDVTYANPVRTQPLLDLEASTRVQQYDLTLDVSGPFDRLKFSYRSDPPLSTADILSLLALGYTEQYSAGGETMSVTTSPHASTSVGASALLSQALSSQVTGRIQRLFGVSRIKIDPNVGTPGYGSGARVTFEEQITHDFTVTYVTNTAYSQYRIIQVEWALSDKVSLLGVRDQNGVFGLELKFRNRFK